jgi:tetratricopeptide (TPR) repeat protein
MKLLYIFLMTFFLSACADLSMYNEIPAPVEGSGKTDTYSTQTTSPSIKTFPIDDQPVQRKIELGSNETSSSQNPAVVALLDSAYQQRDSGQLGIAASKLERAVRIAPRDAKVWHALATVRNEQRQYALSISLARKSNLLSNNDKFLQRDNWLLIANNYDALGDVKLAQQARDNANRLY